MCVNKKKSSAHNVSMLYKVNYYKIKSRNINQFFHTQHKIKKEIDM